MQRMNVTLREEHIDWFTAHDEINSSGLIRKLLDEFIAEHECSDRA